MKFVLIFAIIAALFVADVRAKDAKCEACKTVVTIVDWYLKQGKTVEEIKKLVEKLCATLPAQYAEICNAILDGEIEQIVNWIESFTPEEVCEKVGICLQAKETEDVKCSMCTAAVHTLEQFITSETTEKQLEKWLEDICDTFASASVCHAAIEYGIPKLLALLVAKQPPEVVCKELKLCP